VRRTCEAFNATYFVRGTCEAGGRIKPGAQAPGQDRASYLQAHEMGDSVKDSALPPAYAGSFALF
jgi:hypothetical protein